MGLSGRAAAVSCVLVAALTAVHAYESTINRDYFIFPPLIDSIPVFNVGDTVNVTWASDYANRNLNVWCAPGISLGKKKANPGTQKVQSFSNLPSNGTQLLPVLDTWKDPCHLQFLYKNASTGETLKDFNSGAFNVDSKSASTPRTWRADPTNPGVAASYTGGAPVAAPTNTIPVSAASDASSTSKAQHCNANGNGSGNGGSNGPSFGAGIGAGIGISAGVALLTALVAIPLLRKRSRRHDEARNAPAQEMATDADNATMYEPQTVHPYVVGKSFYEAQPQELAITSPASELPADIETPGSDMSKATTPP